MDLLYHRYASPLSLLETAAGNGCLKDTVVKVLEKQEEQLLWELYLSQPIKDSSFMDWKTNILEQPAAEEVDNRVSRAEVHAAVENSKSILNNFIPPESR